MEYDKIHAVNTVHSGNGKMMFVYQSKEMENLYKRYGNHMIHKICITVVLRGCTDKCKFSGVLCNSSTKGIN